jgi:MFS family permease
MTHRAGFWMVATAFLVSMAFSTVPTPLWPLYQQADAFPTSMITVAFSAYAVGVLISLFLVGHMSDWVGRRLVLLPGVLIEALAAAIFLTWHSLPVLIVARVIGGLGIGLITATGTAYLAELTDRPAVAGQVATAANLGGLGLGALVSGMFAQFVTGPLTTVYAAFLVALLLCAAGLLLVPETVVRTRQPYRPQRVSVPAHARGRYLTVAAGAFTSFALFGLFTSLTPKILATTGHTSALLSGAVSFVVFLFGVLAQLGVGRVPADRQLTIGTGTLVAGVALLLAGATTGSLSIFMAAGALAGAGAGVLFKGALVSATQLADPAAKGEAAAGIFLAGYVGLTLPVLGMGLATSFLSLATGLTLFCLVILAALAVVGTGLRRTGLQVGALRA